MVMRRFFISTIREMVFTPFISTWRTSNISTGSSTSNEVKLPLVSTGTYNFTVNWGDGNEDTITVWNQVETTHTYAATGDYTITITGVCTGWRFSNTGDRLKILTVSQWGGVKFLPEFGNSQGVFWGCSNLDVTATDSPILPAGLCQFFKECTSLVGNSSFNNWNLSEVTALGFAFQNGMFTGCSNFNQPIGNWNVSSVTNMRDAFQGCANFNQNIGSWNVGNVTNFTRMFSLSGFNNGGSDSIKDWDVSKATQMGGMFAGTPFNQPVGDWNIENVLSTAEMFANATAFNQNIGSWNVSKVTDFTNFMIGKTNLNYSTTNLDAIYNGWTNRILSVSEAISFGTIKYTASATAARALLTRANATVTVTTAVNNGSGLIRITTGTAHGRTTGDKIFISGVTGATEANGGWIITVIDATTIDLQSSTFTNAYVSGGTVRTGYGWTITDGGL